MRHLLGTLALLLALTACGDDDSTPEVAEQPPLMDPVLVHATAGEGDPATRYTPLPDDASVEKYVGQFDDALAGQIREEVDGLDVPDGQVLVAQVVAIGCDVPPGATVGADAIVADKVASPLQECLAPVTTVALATVPELLD